MQSLTFVIISTCCLFSLFGFLGCDAHPTALYLYKPPLRFDLACQESVQGEESESVNLTCPDNKKIWVFWAIFGRTDSWTCRGRYPDVRCGNRIQDTNTVKDLCEGTQTCQINASTDVFGDPCEDVDKFLQVYYKCV